MAKVLERRGSQPDLVRIYVNGPEVSAQSPHRTVARRDRPPGGGIGRILVAGTAACRIMTGPTGGGDGMFRPARVASASERWARQAPAIARFQGAQPARDLAGAERGAARLAVLEVACSRRDRRGRLYTRCLIAERGADMPPVNLLRIPSAGCPKCIAVQRHDVCGAHFPGLARVRL